MTTGSRFKIKVYSARAPSDLVSALPGERETLMLDPRLDDAVVGLHGLQSQQGRELAAGPLHRGGAHEMLACGAVPIRGRDGDLRLDLGLLAAISNTGDVQWLSKFNIGDLVSESVRLCSMG